MKTTILLLFLFLGLTNLFAGEEFDLSPKIIGAFPNSHSLRGDFDGDGYLDIVVYSENSGEIQIGLNNANTDYDVNARSNLSFLFVTWATVTPLNDWTFDVGDFNGDNKLDIIGYHPSYWGNTSVGSLWVGINNGHSFTFLNWAQVSPAEDWQFKLGDFTNDGLLDIVGYHPSFQGSTAQGSIWVGENKGTRFSFSQNAWTSVSPSIGWHFSVGDFDSDLKLDIVGYHPSNGSIWLLKNNTTNFTKVLWGSVAASDNWEFLTGDFNSDSQIDLLGYNSTNGTLNLLANNGSFFLFSTWATVSPQGGWKFCSGNYSGSNSIDLVGYHPSNSKIWLFFNTNNSHFKFNEWNTGTNYPDMNLQPSVDWYLQNGDFNNDQRDDILCHNSILGSIRVGLNTPTIEGYCWPLSARPNQTIDFMLSGNGRHLIEFYKCTSFNDNVDTILRASDTIIDTKACFYPQDAAQQGCAWPITYSLRIPADWESGFYTAKLIDAKGRNYFISFIVKSPNVSPQKVALIANVNTWQAYNTWQGGSKYTTTSSTFSFLRPNPLTDPFYDKPNENEQFHTLRGELWIYSWLFANGYTPDLYTDIDLHNGEVSNSYKYVVLSTHPEYWTTEIYDFMSSFIKNGGEESGGNLISLGGNTAYEVCSYNFIPSNKQIVFYGGINNSNRNDFLFRNPGNLLLSNPRPEKELLGIHTSKCDAPYEQYKRNTSPSVTSTKHYKEIFKGVSNLSFGFNSWGIPGMKASGWETESTSDINDCAGMSPFSISTPSNLIVLATSDPSGYSEMTIIPSSLKPRRGFVFAVGSLSFGSSLLKDMDLQTIIKNVLNPTNIGTLSSTGLEENEIPDFIVSPNPATNDFEIIFDEPFGKFTLYLKDVLGNVISKQDIPINHSKSIFIKKPETVKSGIYFLEILSSEVIYQRKPKKILFR